MDDASKVNGSLPEPVELTDDEMAAVSGGGSMSGYTDTLNGHSNEFNNTP